MSGGYHREPGCQCAEPELHDWKHDPWCPLNPLFGKRPQMLFVCDPPCTTQASDYARELRSKGINIVAIPVCALNGPNQSRWLVQTDPAHVLLLCKPENLAETDKIVQETRRLWTEIYQEQEGKR